MPEHQLQVLAGGKPRVAERSRPRCPGSRSQSRRWLCHRYLPRWRSQRFHGETATRCTPFFVQGLFPGAKIPCSIPEIPRLNEREVATVEARVIPGTRRELPSVHLSELTEWANLEPLRVSHRVAEHLQKHRSQQLLGEGDGLLALASDGVGLVEDVGDAALLVKRGIGHCDFKNVRSLTAAIAAPVVSRIMSRNEPASAKQCNRNRGSSRCRSARRRVNAPFDGRPDSWDDATASTFVTHRRPSTSLDLQRLVELHWRAS